MCSTHKVYNHLPIVSNGSSKLGALFRAIANKEVDKAIMLVRDQPDLINMQDNLGNTPLIFAADYGVLRFVHYLLKHGADPHISNKRLEYPLHRAVINRSKKLVGELLKHYENPDLANVNGNTPLFYAVIEGRLGNVNLLLESGAEVNKVNNSKYTPLTWAVLLDNVEMVKHLILNGADYNITVDGSLLYNAISFESENSFLYLVREVGLDLKADPNLSDMFLMACEHGLRRAVAVILENSILPYDILEEGYNLARSEGYDRILAYISIAKGIYLNLSLDQFRSNIPDSD